MVTVEAVGVAVLAMELQQLGNLLKWQIEAGLAEGTQLLPDACNGRFGRKRHGVVDGQSHVRLYSVFISSSIVQNSISENVPKPSQKCHINKILHMI